jgi:hypothetical protein
LLVRDGDEHRADQARAFEEAVGFALGPRLAEADTKKLHDVVADVTKARGEVFASAVAWDDPQGLSLRAAVRDPEAATRGVRGAVDLLKIAPFKELLHVRDVTASSEDLAGVGKATVAIVAREAPKPVARAGGDAGAPRAIAPARSDDLGAAWLIDGGFLSLAVGAAPIATLRASTKPDRKLADEPAIARSFTALANQASAVLILQPLRFDATRANLPAAPLLFALGRRDKDATLRIDIANGLLRELARRQMGL